MRDEKLIREVEGKRRIRSIRRAHAITGAITFFILNLVSGLPLSLKPLGLLINALVSVTFGMPIGYLISRWRGGAFRGAMISAATFIVVQLVVGLLAGDPTAIGSALAWGIAGLLPGAFIGIHVEQDE